MNIIRKDATITNTDEEFPGAFEVVLSTPAKDRDGDELAAEDWKQPLPDHITFDTDHGMSVAATVGSGAPSMEDGKIVVRGTYSSLPRAQEARTLVKEGHIRTVSVAFMSEKVTKDGKTRTVRELLNGAFVAIPSNREAVILASKGMKAGARNSAADMAHVQAIYDHAVALGAGPMDDSGAEEGAIGGKSGDARETKEFVDADATVDPARLAQAVDASLDDCLLIIDQLDRASLPPQVQQLLDTVTAAAVCVDELLDAMGVDDPDDTDDSEETTPAAKTVNADALELQNRLTAITVTALAG